MPWRYAVRTVSSNARDALSLSSAVLLVPGKRSMALNNDTGEYSVLMAILPRNWKSDKSVKQLSTASQDSINRRQTWQPRCNETTAREKAANMFESYVSARVLLN